MDKVPCIFVGCGNFAFQRLQIIINSNKFHPVACVDLNVDKAKLMIKSLRSDVSKRLGDHVYTTISEAIENNNAEACFIYVSSTEHSRLIIESLELGLNTFCVKSIACNIEEFKKIINVYRSRKNLMLVQLLNNQWNESASKMIQLLKEENGIGEMIAGNCICWGRQKLNPQPDTEIEGLFFHALACHQLSQLVSAKGLPNYVTSMVHQSSADELGFTGVWGTGGGQCLFEFDNGAPFSYSGTRIAHGNPFGFASRWSGQWIFHGENGDIKRDGGRITLYRNGAPVEDYFLKDLDEGLINDDKIQFDALYDAILFNKNRDTIQDISIDTWILMEACNESARSKKRIDLIEFKNLMMAEND